MSNINLEQLELTQSLAQKRKMTTDAFLASFRKYVLANLKGTISNEEVVSLLTIAERYDVDPFLGHFYAFQTTEGKIVPVLTYDGWVHIVNRNPQYDGEAFAFSESRVGEPVTQKKVHEWIECTIYRKDRQYPVVVREYFNENYQDASVNTQDANSDQGAWQKLPNRRLRMQAFVQAARLAFGITGVYHQQDLQQTSAVKRTPAVDAPGQQQVEQPEPIVSLKPQYVNAEKVEAFVKPLIQRAKELKAWGFLEPYLKGHITDKDELQFALQLIEKAMAEHKKSSPDEDKCQRSEEVGVDQATLDVTPVQNDETIEAPQVFNAISNSAQVEGNFGVLP